MKISFYSQELIKKQKTGVGWTIYHILDNLSKIKNCDFKLDYFTNGYKKEQLNEIMRFEEKGFLLNSCNRFNDIIYRYLWNIIPIPYSFFFGEDSEITQFFNYYIPPGVKGKKVTVIYDMTFKVFPETVRKRTLFFLALNIKKACNRADKIITISEFSKNEIIKYLKVEPDKISIMPCGVDQNKFHNNYTIKEINEAKKKYGIEDEYFLYLGTLEPRKNVERLVKAYSLLKKEKFKIPKLVLAGKKGWLYNEIFNIIETEGINADIIFTDYVDENNVPLLMGGAKAFVFPSIYEGFGLPPLEAMACGTPVITSNVASLPEVVEGAALMVNPFSVDEIKEAMLHIMESDELANQLIEKGFNRVKKFTWENSTRVLLQIYQNLLNEVKSNENSI
ncbi:glycosyltransferase family 4 protein [Anaerocolumna xylanovorans]|uniref:Glycosyltransferase involved in cell wall bisynthesis n=1 Tax=Anaerocolumna xylanovorans DSM 12503 TaxID=1121345 RepID=A0A1M7Y4A3_9FIRM|nr:glycosyltransferase family 1 protein [Anaerocolumna xylanovorans]SHO47123.1 Glycosyltransferase involved in cell wall bisynthesis [Anaerocolumna xylanovorans DSM 12503]